MEISETRMAKLEIIVKKKRRKEEYWENNPNMAGILISEHFIERNERNRTKLEMTEK